MNFAELGDALGLDEEEFKELAELFVETADADIVRMTNGLAANDATEVMEASHSIKGAAGNLGFMDVSQWAGDIELKSRSNDLTDLTGLLEKIKIGVEAIRILF